MDIGPIKQKIKQNEFLKKIVFYSITSPKNPKPRSILGSIRKEKELSFEGEDPVLMYSLGISSR